MQSINFNTTDTTFTLIVDGNEEGTWNKLDEIDSKFDIVTGDRSAVIDLFNLYYSNIFTEDDTISINDEELEGTFRNKIEQLKDEVFYLERSEGGASTLQATLGDYQNSAMAASVKAYIFKDENGNIVRVYEPLRNNDVSCKEVAYLNSIDKFPFDNELVYNNFLIDVKLSGIEPDFIFNSNILYAVVINANNHTGCMLQNVFWKGDYGENTPNDAELYITDDGVQVYDCNIWYGAYIDSPGAASAFYGNTIMNGATIRCNGFVVSVRDTTMCDKSSVEFLAAGIVNRCMLSNASSCQIRGSMQFSTVGNSASVNVTNPLEYSNISPGATADTVNGSISACDIGVYATFAPSSNQSGKRIINIGGDNSVLGTNYQLAVAGGNVTATEI